MDDIIVLILTLLFIAAGIFGQMKKQQLPTAEQDDDEPGRVNFWESLDEEEQHQVGITEHLKPAEEVAKEDRFHSAGNIMKRDFSSAPVKSIRGKKKHAAAGLKKFPLKKAVIYSEILNRKYF